MKVYRAKLWSDVMRCSLTFLFHQKPTITDMEKQVKKFFADDDGLTPHMRNARRECLEDLKNHLDPKGRYVSTEETVIEN